MSIDNELLLSSLLTSIETNSNDIPTILQLLSSNNLTDYTTIEAIDNNNTFLQHVLSSNNSQLFQQLITLNYINPNGILKLYNNYTPIIYLIHNGRVKMIEIFLSSFNKDIIIQSLQCTTPIGHYYHHHNQIFNHELSLYHHLALFHSNSTKTLQSTPSSTSPASTSTPNTTQNDTITYQLMKLFQQFNFIPNDEEYQQYPAIIYACHLGQLQYIQYLLEFNADVMVKTVNDETPLMAATFSGNVELIDFILNLDPKFVEKINEDGQNGAEDNTSDGTSKQVNASTTTTTTTTTTSNATTTTPTPSTSPFDIYTINKYGDNSLSIAAEQCYIHVIKHYQQKFNIDLTLYLNEKGQTLLHSLCQNPMLPIEPVVTEDTSVETNNEPTTSTTSSEQLHSETKELTTHSQSTSISEPIPISTDAATSTTTSDQSTIKTSDQSATTPESTPMTPSLEELQPIIIDPSQQPIPITKPLQYITKSKYLAFLEYIYPISILFYPTDRRDSKGISAMSYAFMYGNIVAIDFLLTSGSQLKFVTQHRGDNIWHFIAKSLFEPKMIDYIISLIPTNDRSQNINGKNRKNLIPIQTAIEYDNLYAIQAFLKRPGININAVNKYGFKTRISKTNPYVAHLHMNNNQQECNNDDDGDDIDGGDIDNNKNDEKDSNKNGDNDTTQSQTTTKRSYYEPPPEDEIYIPATVSLLHIAVAKGNYEVIKYFLFNTTIHPDYIKQKQQTLLEFVCQSDFIHVLPFLINLRQEYKDDSTLLSKLTFDIYPLAPSKLAIPKPTTSITTTAEPIVELQYTILHQAVSAGAIECLKYLITNNILPIDIPNSDGQSPLFYAITTHRYELLLQLIEYGANINHVDNFGHTIFIYAIQAHFEEFIQYCVMNFPHLITKCDARGFSPIFHAIILTNLRMFTYLHSIAYCDLTTISKDGNNIFHIIGQTDYQTLQFIQYVIPFIRNYNNNRSAVTTTTTTTKPVQDDIVTAYFISQYNTYTNIDQIYFDQANNNGYTPLLYAAHYGNVIMMDYLWSQGANPYQKTKNGLNLLECAIQGGIKATEWVLKRMRSIIVPKVVENSNADNKDGENSGDNNTTTINVRKSIPYYDHSAINSITNEYPIHLAVKLDRCECAQILIDHKADPFVETNDDGKYNILHFATSLTAKRFCKAMLDIVDDETTNDVSKCEIFIDDENDE